MRIKNSILIQLSFICLLNSSMAISQKSSESALIDQQVWKPFIESYSTFDHEAFNDIHSDQLIRINSKELRDAEAYKAQNTNWFKRAKKEGYKQSIRFNFEKRIVTADMAFETGYYKIVITKPDGKVSDYFARFHVMLKKENGRWKIVQDWDSSTINGEKVTQEDFLKASGKVD
ncbi:YybH family protein [Winogradskyella sp.]|uniref:YybH family protein n=1 Tax=Winogradskyella sp. TaxID=1883156 RepID=UPI003BA8A0BD